MRCCVNDKCIVLLYYIFIRCASALSSNYNSVERKCEPIQIDLCQGIGYNETSMPNHLGNEMQSDVAHILYTFAPLIEFECSPYFKLFLCASYVPMCASKIPMQIIGPCQSLCETVRSDCGPVLRNFGFPWPPALDCLKFPKINNEHTMCMEIPSDARGNNSDTNVKEKIGDSLSTYEHYNITIKSFQSQRCRSLCNEDVLFSQNDKSIAEIWVSTLTFTSLVLAVGVIICKLLCCEIASQQYCSIFTSLMWCNFGVTIGWALRFTAGRSESSCGFDAEISDEKILLIDGLYNTLCTIEFLLRYYFGMSASLWWAAICLGWRRDLLRLISVKRIKITNSRPLSGRNRRFIMKNQDICIYEITQSNFFKLLAWGLPALLTAVIIVVRLIDADELLGSCYVGNQSERGLLLFVATPVFCFWIFGFMNLISGFLIYIQGNNLPKIYKSDIGHFLVVYSTFIILLLICSVYEYLNKDSWISSFYDDCKKLKLVPMWPFLGRPFMELLLSLFCSAWLFCFIVTRYFKSKFKSDLKPICNEIQISNHDRQNQKQVLFIGNPLTDDGFLDNNIIKVNDKVEQTHMYTLDVI